MVKEHAKASGNFGLAARLGHYENNAPLARLTPDATDGPATLGPQFMGALPQNYKTIGLQGNNKTTYNMFCAATATASTAAVFFFFWDLPSVAQAGHM